jgi:hypothetical protein
MNMPWSARAAWDQFAASMFEVDRRRSVTIHVLAEDSLFRNDMSHVVNVHARGLTAISPSMYDMKDVTGVDFVVQAVLVTQALAAELVHEACCIIESENLNNFGFVCSHGTHRSLGCAMLLAILAYPNARVCLSTPRTMRAAIARGMIPCQA